MNYLNKKEFEFCNIIEFHNAGYTGKGVRVAIVERDIDTEHGRKVLDVLKQVAPNCEVKVLKYDLFGAMEYKNFNIVSKSLSGQRTQSHIQDEEFKATNTLLIAASGNDGEKWMSAYARQQHWISVGAVHLTNSNPVRPSYSSIGEEMEVVGFSNLQTQYGKIQGTSFATPFVAGMVALYYQFYKERFGIFPTPQNAREFIKNNTMDLGILGHDREYGNGLYILPKIKNIKLTPPVKEVEKMKIELQLGNPKMIVDGKEHILRVEPFLKSYNNELAATCGELRPIFEILGYKVDWIESENKIIITD